MNWRGQSAAWLRFRYVLAPVWVREPVQRGSFCGSEVGFVSPQHRRILRSTGSDIATAPYSLFGIAQSLILQLSFSYPTATLIRATP